MQLLKKFRFLFITFLFLSTGVFSQTEQPANKPCQSEEAKQFDFWIGEWELSWPAEQFGGKPGKRGFGTNSIRKILDGCVIREEFHFPAKNFKGQSFSAYSPQKKIWQQTWVDNQGAYIVFTGKMEQGRMELRTHPKTLKDKVVQSRMVFRNISKESFDWDWQKSEDGAKTWTDQWNIHYKRIKQ